MTNGLTKDADQWIYAIGSPYLNFVKVGLTNFTASKKEKSKTIAHALYKDYRRYYPCMQIWLFLVPDCKNAEKDVHELLKEYRISDGCRVKNDGEHFNCSIIKVLSACNRIQFDQQMGEEDDDLTTNEILVEEYNLVPIKKPFPFCKEYSRSFACFVTGVYSPTFDYYVSKLMEFDEDDLCTNVSTSVDVKFIEFCLS